MTPPPPGRTTWSEAFPYWELVFDHVPVGGSLPVADTLPEDRVETILEIASTYRTTPDYVLGELYPLVPAGFGVRWEGGGEVSFSSIASSAPSDISQLLSRAESRRLHGSLAQVNAAAAASRSGFWPQEPVIRAVSSVLFSLDPERFYALVDVQLLGGDRAAAQAYVERELHGDLDAVIDAAVADTREVLDSTEVGHWFDSLRADSSGHAVHTHPQLMRPVGLLDVPLATVCELLVPEVGEILRATPPATPAAPTPRGLKPVGSKPMGPTPTPVDSTPSVESEATTPAPEPSPPPAVDEPATSVAPADPLPTPLTADDDIDTWEQAVRARLGDAVLAVEADFSAVGLDVLLDVFAARYRLSRGRGTTVAQIVHHFPATTLASLVGMAHVGLEHNAYWDAYWERLGVERQSSDEAALRTAIPALLKRFGLDPLHDLPVSRYVQRLAVHAGIPAASFDGLLEALSAYVGNVTSRESRRFRDWILEPSHELVLNQLDVSTRDFIQYGGDRGRTFLDEMARIVADIAENPAADPATLSADGTSLPEMVVDALREALLRADVGERVRTERRRSRQVPTLHLQADDSIVVRIPAPSSHTSAPWTVTIDTSVVRVAPEKFRNDQAVEVPVDHPARRIVVSHPSYAHPVEMRLYEDSRPIIAFSTHGEHLSDAAVLPRSEIVAVVPGDLTVLGAPPHAPRDIGGFGAPIGWDGWQIRQWDLSETTSVRARTGEDTTVDLRVGSRPLPVLLDLPDDPLPVLPGVFNEKMPVLHSRPWISLPALGPKSEHGWTIRYRRSGAREWITQGEYATPDAGDVPLFDGEPEQLGRFDIRVTGPDGTRLDQSVFVAEGLTVEFDDDLRLPDDENLTPVIAECSSELPALEVFDRTLEFGPGDSKKTIRLRNGSASAVVTVRPPRLEFRLTPVGRIPVWSDRRIGRRPEDFSQATLAIRGVPTNVSVRAVVRSLNGREYGNEDIPRRTRSGVLTMPADRLAGAARVAQIGEVVVVLRYPDGETYDAPLIRFSTVGANVRVEIEGDQVHVLGLDVRTDIVLHVWRIARPWAPVVTVPLSQGRGTLPASVLKSGDIRVAPVVDDAWDPVPPEGFPPPESIRFPREAEFTSPATTGLSRFLLGLDEQPNVDPSQPEIWSALALLGRNLEAGDDEKFSLLSHELRHNPRPSLLSLAASELSTADKLALLIRTGLVFDSFRPDEDDPDSVVIDRRVLASEPWLDMLLTIADLPATPDAFRAGMRRRLREVGGYALSVILERGWDPFAKSSALSRDLVLRSDEPGAVADYLENKKLIPGGLIDPASRHDAYLALFRHKDTADPVELREFFEVVVRGGGNPMSVVGGFQALRSTFTVRSKQLGTLPDRFAWANAPVASLIICLYARLAAADRIRLAPPFDLDRVWSRFALREPEQTMIDLVTAEAMVTGLDYAKRQDNPFLPVGEPSDEELVDAIFRI
ncbi:hypothetical protein [Dietzia natronolimnaea]|uniref:hypothetical protein n=1 Tax=Dietzia natronolimnaea TaxID=161920 RepID=UPI0015FB38FC|nr:hypothetical protein [Dietzia natronolimnaea]MBB1038568.1 hypothetical protein [Dietzia natronolimnaea]